MTTRNTIHQIKIEGWVSSEVVNWNLGWRMRVNLGVPIHHLHCILIRFQVNESFWCSLSHSGRNSHTIEAVSNTLSPILRFMENEKVGLRR